MAKHTPSKLFRLLAAIVLAGLLLLESTSPTHSQPPPTLSLPSPSEVDAVARRVNDYWIANRPGPEDNNWSRGTYFTGNMAHYRMTGDAAYLDNAWQWAEGEFNWQLNGGCTTVFAENHTAAQTYLDLYAIDPPRADLACLLTSIETSMRWGWIEVDLGAPTNVQRVLVDTFQDRAYRYLVDVKAAPTAPYTMVIDRSVAIPDTTPISVTAQFVRVRVIGADGYNEQRVSLDEVQIFGASAPATNLALNRPVTCSDEPEPENGCTRAVDGNTATAWSMIIPDDFTIHSPKWWWVDALYVAMPVFATLSNLEAAGVLTDTLGYSPALFAKYDETKTQRGLWDASEGLWYRDLRFVDMRSPNDEKVFWSRGNGWAIAALARVLEILPTTDPHYGEYLDTFKVMALALRATQDEAGFWHQNLADPNHCGGPESSGTAFFVYGLAWGINNGHLARTEFLPTTLRAWEWLADVAVQSEPDGLFGYVQPVGDAPICDEATPLPGPTTTEDFGVGTLLLAASEVVKLETSHNFPARQRLPLLYAAE